MKFPSPDKITGYLILTVMMIFLFFLINAILMFIVGPSVINSNYPYVYMACQALGTVIALRFFYRKLYNSIVAQEQLVNLSPVAGAFTGLVRGAVFALFLLIAAMFAALFLIPEKLFHPEIYKIAVGTVMAGAAAGSFFPCRTVGRKTRLWLLLAAVCSVFILQIMKVILLLFINTPFDYTSPVNDHKKFPAIGTNTLSACLPENSTKIHIYGIRGRTNLIQWNAECSREDFDRFCEKNKYKILTAKWDGKLFNLEEIPGDAIHGGKIFANKTLLIFVYFPSTRTIYGILDKRGAD